MHIFEPEDENRNAAADGKTDTREELAAERGRISPWRLISMTPAAAAVALAVMATSCSDTRQAGPPQATISPALTSSTPALTPCLSIVMTPKSATPTPPPTPCLSPPLSPLTPAPTPCLKIALPTITPTSATPSPAVCLSIAPTACLKIAVPLETSTQSPAPRPCLSIPQGQRP